MALRGQASQQVPIFGVVKIKYNLVKFQDSDEANLTVFVNGEMYVATDSHPNFKAILVKVAEEDESVVDLFDVSKTAEKRFDRLSERVTVSNGRIYFDGEEVDNALTSQVLRFIDGGVEDFNPLVKFFEKVMTNPNEHSREQLYRWLARYDFTITDEGDFIAYKGVATDAEGNYVSVNHGRAISNGVEYNGAIPNPLGAVVEMPRGDVQHDPSVGCHVGLHAGTYEYARQWAKGGLLTVVINPRDVVSVPTDCQDQKLRVCRYTVQEVTEVKYSAPVISFDEEDDEDEDACYNCGYVECECCGECGSAYCYDEECMDCPDCGERDCECCEACEAFPCECPEPQTPAADLDAFVKGINTVEGFKRGYLGNDWPDAPWNK
ncbi:rIIB-like protein [Streptomyces phage BillNye]|uniref:RIIB-like protein n=2 Tax=Wilnyevirus billnye TaxID=2560486 RepID=A0A2L1IVW4_9CAUD|nr:RIIB lysis inhibitor [Streptomyces phage BillNye]AVD99308.1 rIIB-like protein [Streptomyces phage BillNye]QBZ72391.1 rIIB-like protein [Streptomyces phage Circinus]